MKKAVNLPNAKKQVSKEPSEKKVEFEEPNIPIPYTAPFPEQLLDVNEIKRKFLEESNLDHIDESLHVYLSISMLEKTVTDILGPILVRAKEESVFVKDARERLTT